MAKITETIRGADKVIRSARVLTRNGQLVRPITKLYPLEVRSFT